MIKLRIICMILVFQFLSACQEAITTPLATNSSSPASILQGTQVSNPGSINTETPGVPEKVQPAPSATLDPLDIAEIVLTELSIDQAHEYSPNGNCEWKRIVASPSDEINDKYANQFFTYVTVTCANQDKPWVLEQKWTEQGLGYPLTSLLAWSADGRYAYYYDQIIPDGCPPVGGFQQDLRQVDLDTGAIHSFPITWTGGMALSPDSTKVIYYDHQAADVGIFDLTAQNEQRVSFDLPAGLDSWFAGDFTWSPDGQSAIFIISYGDACFPTGVSLRHVDLRANKVRTLLEGEIQAISIIDWIAPEQVLISINGEQEILDLQTGEISAP